MPKSKRNSTFNLTKTDKKTRQDKLNLVQEIRNSIDIFKNIYIFKVENFRNSIMKNVRVKMEGKFYFGSNKVMQKALGLTPEEEYLEGTRFLAQKLNGNVGLFFSDMEPAEVKAHFESFVEKDYARAGGIATHDFVVHQGNRD